MLTSMLNIEEIGIIDILYLNIIILQDKYYGKINR
jgi:hypothetical protein